jgi:glycine/D-amino acid oxidase-like deaminating enzyme
METNQKVDVGILGGGVTGLACGWWLRRRSPQTSLALWEAGERAGGRIGSRREQGYQAVAVGLAQQDSAAGHGFLMQEARQTPIVQVVGLQAQCVGSCVAGPREWIDRPAPVRAS